MAQVGALTTIINLLGHCFSRPAIEKTEEKLEANYKDMVLGGASKTPEPTKVLKKSPSTERTLRLGDPPQPRRNAAPSEPVDKELEKAPELPPAMSSAEDSAQPEGFEAAVEEESVKEDPTDAMQVETSSGVEIGGLAGAAAFLKANREPSSDNE